MNQWPNQSEQCLRGRFYVSCHGLLCNFSSEDDNITAQSSMHPSLTVLKLWNVNKNIWMTMGWGGGGRVHPPKNKSSGDAPFIFREYRISV